ncbi:hypothetical protein HK414_24725 [Ramlibacter terrae]|uniref:Uncharacterized protein n=1 Tax=Ramlibacter terrae TaxID=2732511 RepID=A0ABX6P5Q7_9BURK|nr:hypothetical protein HK414_24725 [Ramlibacter terrae]
MVAMHDWGGTSVAMYIGTSFPGMTFAPASAPRCCVSSPRDDFGHIPAFNVVLRYRPEGAGTLAPGQFALFNSTDCTGAAMVVDNFDLPATSGGTPGNFTGSMLLGERTRVSVFPQQVQKGNGIIVNASGCPAPGARARCRSSPRPSRSPSTTWRR